MGWLFMSSLEGHAGPRSYLDNQFTYERDGLRSTVLASALVRMRTYYAAVEHVRDGEAPEVFAVVCLVRYNPRDREGYIFGYKDLTEHMGPVEAECPAGVLDMLTPTDNPHALAWRERCRNAIAARAKRPRLKPGMVVVFDAPLRFTDGTSHQRLAVVIDPSNPRVVRFRPLGDKASGGGPLYRIGGLRRLDYRVEPPA